MNEKKTDDSDIKIYGAEQKAAETEAADEYEAYEPENADLPDNESDEGIEMMNRTMRILMKVCYLNMT